MPFGMGMTSFVSAGGVFSAPIDRKESGGAPSKQDVRSQKRERGEEDVEYSEEGQSHAKRSRRVCRPCTPPLPEPVVCEKKSSGITSYREWQNICDRVDILVSRGTHVQEVVGPAMVIGDLHGDYVAAKFYCDCFRELAAKGQCNSIVFLGDYIDRGPDSLKTIELVFKLKIDYPEQVYLLRGNHETDVMVLENEDPDGLLCRCVGIYGDDWGYDIYSRILEIFRSLPLTAVIDGKTFCAHGGIPAASEKFSSGPCTLKQIRDIPRINPTGFIVDNILWNDYSPRSLGFSPNPDRGFEAARQFGNDIIDRFLEENGLELIVRGHEHFRAIPQDGLARNNHGRFVTILGIPDYAPRFNIDTMRNSGCAPIVRGGKIIYIIKLKYGS